MVLLWFTIFLGRGSLWLPCGLSHHTTPHSVGQGTTVGILPVLSVSIPTVHPDLGNNPRVKSGVPREAA